MPPLLKQSSSQLSAKSFLAINDLLIVNFILTYQLRRRRLLFVRFRAAEWRCQAQKTAPELQRGPPAVEAKKPQAMLMATLWDMPSFSRTLVIAELLN